jgi:formate C-acetyltransferase
MINLADIQNITKDTVKKIGSFPIVLPEDGIIAGISELCPYDISKAIEYFGYEPFYGTDNIHFSMDLAFLDLGIDTMLKKLSNTLKTASTPERRAYAEGIYKTYEAISKYITAHAEAAENAGLDRIARNCGFVAHHAPESFEQALQLFWFVWTIRSELSHIHFRNPGYYMGALGRWDQHFYKYYEHDIENGLANREEIFEIVKEAFIKMNRLGIGDTLKNMMLGGQDKDGNDQANDLTLLIMDVMLEIKVAEPHLNLRIYPSMSSEYYDRGVRLALMGQGHGEVFNDNVIIPKLQQQGIPDEIAYNYSCDGCEELIIDRYGAVLFKELEAIKVLEIAYFNGQENPYQGNKHVKRWADSLDSREIQTALTLGYESGDMKKASTYDEVYEMFMKQYRFQVDQVLKFMDESMYFYKNKCIASMALAGGYMESIETGADPYRDIIKYMFFEIQSGSITPVADSLAAIKKVVFEEGFATMKELIDAISKNFEGYELLRKRLLAAPKFGNDDDYADLIASDISSRFCDWVSSFKKRYSEQYLLPAIYSIFFLDHSALTSATSDGRLCGDPIAVQFSPGPGRAKSGPTAVLSSAAKTDLTKGLGGSVVFLTISRSLIPQNREGERLVDAIIRASVEMKIPIMSLAINDVEALRDAQKRPELYEDLIVRVWGFNARFIDLTPEMQNHVITRTIGE